MAGKRALIWGKKRKPSVISSFLRDISDVIGANVIDPVWHLSCSASSFIEDRVERLLAPREYHRILERCYGEQPDVAAYARYNVSTGCSGDIFFLQRYENDEKMYSRLLKIRETFFEHMN